MLNRNKKNQPRFLGILKTPAFVGAKRFSPKGVGCIRKLRSDKKVVEREGRGRFVEPNQWQPEYGKKWSDALSFPVVEPAVAPYNPMSTCGSIFIVIETKTK